MSKGTPEVICMVPTYRRAGPLARLLESLTHQDPPVSEVLVVDNGDDPETQAVVQEAGLPIRLLVPGRNLSCGGGLKLAMETALGSTKGTHFWILDDDATTCPGALKAMLQGLADSRADLAVPGILNAEGHLSWPAGLLERGPRDLLHRRRMNPEAYLTAQGPKPIPFSWAPWPSMLLTRKVPETIGFPSDDFWLMGVDIEYSLRATSVFRGVFVPSARCGHEPPPLASREDDEMQHRIKFGALLQNLSYLSMNLNHCRRIRVHVPGNYLRYLRTFGPSMRTFSELWRACREGLLRGRPFLMENERASYDRWNAIQYPSPTPSRPVEVDLGQSQ